MAIATVLVFVFTPPTKMFVDNITSRQLWTELNNRLLPQDKWFGGMAWMIDGLPPAKAGDAMPAAANPIATGSIVPAETPKDR